MHGFKHTQAKCVVQEEQTKRLFDSEAVRRLLAVVCRETDKDAKSVVCGCKEQVEACFVQSIQCVEDENEPHMHARH